MTAAHHKLFPNSTDPMRNYEREAAERKEAFEREQRQAKESHEVGSLRAEIDDLRTRLDERDQTIVRLADNIDSSIRRRQVERMIEGRVLKSEAEMCGKIAEWFGELRGWISAIDPVRAKVGEAFKFANERDRGDEITEQPNWLPPRCAIN